MMRFVAGFALVAAIAVGLASHKPAPKAPMSQLAEDARSHLLALVPGDTVVLIVDIDPASQPELEPFVRYSVATALAHGAHVVTTSLVPYGAMIAQSILDSELAKANKRYGVDAMNLGFLEGRTAAPHLLGFPLARVTSRDHAGTALADLNITRDIQKLDDAALTVLVSSGGALDWLTQAQGRFAHRLVVASTSQYAPELVPFFESGQIVGLVAGLRDVAALVSIDPQMQAQRWAAIVFIGLIVLGHVVQLVRSRPKAPPKPKAQPAAKGASS